MDFDDDDFYKAIQRLNAGYARLQLEKAGRFAMLEDEDEHQRRRSDPFIDEHSSNTFSFGEHDTRMTARVATTGMNKTSQNVQDRWDHDCYNGEKQRPKTSEELTAVYGYDIRRGAGPPSTKPRGSYRTASISGFKPKALSLVTAKTDNTTQQKAVENTRDKWDHDRYNEDKQRPKTADEMKAAFSFDIRKQAGPIQRSVSDCGVKPHVNSSIMNKTENEALITVFVPHRAVDSKLENLGNQSTTGELKRKNKIDEQRDGKQPVNEINNNVQEESPQPDNGQIRNMFVRPWKKIRVPMQPLTIEKPPQTHFHL